MENKLIQVLFSVILVFQLAFGAIPSAAFAQENDATTNVNTTEDKVAVDEEIEEPSTTETAINQAEQVEAEETESEQAEQKDDQQSSEAIDSTKVENETEADVEKSTVVEVPKETLKTEPPTITTIEEPIVKKESVKQKFKKLQARAAIEEKIIQSVTYVDKDGKPLDQNTAISMGDEIVFKADWALPEPHSYIAGDTYSFKLPTQLLIASVQNGDLKDSSGMVYGTYTISTNGEVVFTFNDEIEKNSIIKGTFEVSSSLKKDLSGDPNQELVVDVPGDNDWSTGILVKPNIVESLTKKGVLDKAKNPTKVTWTIDINKKVENLGDITLSDTIPAGLTFVSGSIKIYELTVDLNGTVTEGAKIAGIYPKFPLTMKNVTKAYRIVYETKITDKVNGTYTNKASLTANGKTINAEATVTASFLDDAEKKAGDYDPATHLLNWQIKYNQKENTIAKENATFLDYYDGTKMDVIVSSFVVKELSYDADGKEVWTVVPTTEYKVTRTLAGIPEGKTGFRFDFTKAIDKTYVIDYQTQVNPGSVINLSVTNTLLAFGKEWSVNKSASNSFLVKSKGKENYEDKTISWNIIINYDKKILSNAHIAESYPNGGLLLRPSTVQIKNSAGTILLPGVDYTLTDKQGNGFEIQFSNDITDTLTLTYVTDYDTTKTTDGKNTFKNKATMTQTYSGKEYITDGEATFTPGTESQNNGYKYGDYDYERKVFKWTLGVNYNKENVSQLVVTDSSPQDLVTNLSSIKIYKLDLTKGGEGEEVGEFTNFTATAENVNGHPGFRLTFNEAISDAYKITYEATDEDELIIKEYTNKATVTGTKTPSNLTAKIPVLHGQEYTVKYGKQDGDLINWTVNYNFAQSSLTNATLIDKPSENQFVLKDSFHVFVAVPSDTKKGDFTKGEELSSTLYDVIMEDDGSFKLKFKNDIHEGYIIEYQSYINAATGTVVENEVFAESDQIGTEKEPSVEKVTVVLTNSSATASGETGSVTIKKVDSINPNKELKDAKFTLWNVDSDGNKRFALKTLKTDEEGKVTFDKLLYRDYIIVEDSAPTGYKVNINDSTVVTVDEENQELVIKNDPINPTGQLKIIKVDADDATKFLAGAEFRLLNADGKVVIDKIVTGKDGTVTVDVPLVIEFDENGDPISTNNDFTLVETKAPAGYEKDDIDYDLVIEYEGNTEKTIDNAVIKKVPDDTDSPDDDESPVTPITPNLPTDLENEGNHNTSDQGNKETQTSNNNQQSDKVNKVELPQTGIQSEYGLTATGVILLLVAAYFFIRRVRKA